MKFHQAEKAKTLRRKGNRVYIIDSCLMFVHHHNNWYRASTSHDEVWRKITAELEYRPTLEEAVADMVAFAQKHGLQEVTE